MEEDLAFEEKMFCIYWTCPSLRWKSAGKDGVFTLEDLSISWLDCSQESWCVLRIYVQYIYLIQKIGEAPNTGIFNARK